MSHRRRICRASLALSLVLLLAPAFGALAAPVDASPASPLTLVLDWMQDWWTGAGPGAAPRLSGSQEIAPNLDPNGLTTHDPAPLGEGTETASEGDIAPNLDPDG